MARRVVCYFVLAVAPALFSFAGCQSGAGLNGSVQTEKKSENDADHYNRGVALHKKSDLEGAIVEYRKALGLNPNNADVHTYLGSALLAKGDLDGALAEYRTALRLNPNHVAARTNLASALASQGDLNEALAEYRTALRLNPDHVAAHVGLGVVLQRLGHNAEAKGEFQQALKLLEGVPGTEKKVETVRQQLREVE